jgi:hypothetical protein
MLRLPLQLKRLKRVKLRQRRLPLRPKSETF